MKKRGEVNTAWKERYCCLTPDGLLEYYKNSEVKIFFFPK